MNFSLFLIGNFSLSKNREDKKHDFYSKMYIQQTEERRKKMLRNVVDFFFFFFSWTLTLSKISLIKYSIRHASGFLFLLVASKRVAYLLPRMVNRCFDKYYIFLNSFVGCNVLVKIFRLWRDHLTRADNTLVNVISDREKPNFQIGYLIRSQDFGYRRMPVRIEILLHGFIAIFIIKWKKVHANTDNKNTYLKCPQEK